MTSTLIPDITRVSHDIMRVLKRRMVCCGTDDLHMGQLHALAYVSEKGGMTMKQLANALQVSSPSATTFVDRLVAMKFLTRTHDADNRRIVRLTVTPAGRKAYIRKMAEKQRIVGGMLGSVSDADKKEFLRILKGILTNCTKG
ncbi:MAG: MarR family transcriptional regulator [Candidatus Peribacteraceae bacterium]|nr:MarR family transcriptional regulator [Candidatus Peribacteraceae bacterium]